MKFLNLHFGTPLLIKKNIQDFGKCNFIDENIIQENFYFNIIESYALINYSNYELYNDCTTPISIGFYNKNIRENFYTDVSSISYNGLLLKNALIPTRSLKCNVSFCINIVTANNEKYICNINFNIPFENEEDSIYNTGYIIKEIDNSELYNFIRVQ